MDPVGLSGLSALIHVQRLALCLPEGRHSPNVVDYDNDYDDYHHGCEGHS